jgi:hypothetical protein
MLVYWVKNSFTLVVIPGLTKLAPYVIRGNPDIVPVNARNHFKVWIPVSTGNPGFPLSRE